MMCYLCKGGKGFNHLMLYLSSPLLWTSRVSPGTLSTRYNSQLLPVSFPNSRTAEEFWSFWNFMERVHKKLMKQPAKTTLMLTFQISVTEEERTVHFIKSPLTPRNILRFGIEVTSWLLCELQSPENLDIFLVFLIFYDWWFTTILCVTLTCFSLVQAS